MSRKPEQQLWDRIRRNIGPQVLMKRVENYLEAGWPDTITLAFGHVTWLETKVGHWPKRPTTRIQWNHPLQIEQCNFHLDWGQHEGRSLIIAGIEGTIFMIPGNRADDFNSMTRYRIQSYECDWRHLGKYLRGDKLLRSAVR